MAFLSCVLIVCFSGRIIQGLAADESDETTLDISNADARTPSNVRARVGEESAEIHWTPPNDTNGVDICNIEFKESPMWGTPSSPLTITVPVWKDRTSQVLTGLNRDTRYGVRVYCSYGNTRGPSTDWIYLSTRTVTTDKNVCSGYLPNAFLEPTCVDSSRVSWCEYECADGYRKSDVAAVINSNPIWGDSIYIFCRNGTWTTNFEEYGHNIEDICLPEAVFQRCPSTIPNGRLEEHCGPAKDWLCYFDCDEGYHRHSFMTGTLKGFRNYPEKLFCDKGTWKTGYEDIGLNVSGLCYGADTDQNCTDDMPNGRVLYKPCPSGYTCDMACNDGYRERALASGDSFVACNDGEWVLRSTKYDATITPDTVCVRNDTPSFCSRDIPNGKIPEDCMVDCVPQCNEGYKVIGEMSFSMGPSSVTCENGKWLTKSKHYTGDNICFPEEGMLCSPEIPNGKFAQYADRLKDYGRNREYNSYKCNEGFRFHRGVPYIECVAGRWTTWNERFGIGIDDLCIPINQRIQQCSWTCTDV